MWIINELFAVLIMVSNLAGSASNLQPAPQPSASLPSIAAKAKPEPRAPRPRPTPQLRTPKPQAKPIFKKPHPPRESNKNTAGKPSLASSVLGSDWERPARHYSGSGYGIGLLNKRFGESPSQGGYPGDRKIVAQAARRYGLPFHLMWATYGNESGWGKISWKGGIIPYFGLTWDYPGRGTSGNFRRDAYRAAEIWAELYRKYNGRDPSN